MTFKILTIFPEMIESVLSSSILGRARESGAIRTEVIDIRPFSENKHKNTDDTPFGGGAGMVMLAQPIADAMRFAMGSDFHGKRIYLSPKGETFTQKKAEALAREDSLILLCGHYEGVDQRVLDHYIDEEISVGDYVLTGGELGALIVTDAVSRLINGVLGTYDSCVDESFSSGLLEYPQFTRPREFEGEAVPEVLLNGNEALINRWRRSESLRITFERRPGLLQSAPLDKEDRALWRALAQTDTPVFTRNEALFKLLYELGGIRRGDAANADAYIDAGFDRGKKVLATRPLSAEESNAALSSGAQTFSVSPLAFDSELVRHTGDEGIRQALFFGVTGFEFACCAARLLPVRKSRDKNTAEYGKGRRALRAAGSSPCCRITWMNGDTAEFPLSDNSLSWAKAARAWLKDGLCPLAPTETEGIRLITEH